MYVCYVCMMRMRIMCVYMSVCALCVCECVYVWISEFMDGGFGVWMHLRRDLCMYVCTHVRMYGRNVCTRVCMCVRISTKYRCAYVCVDVCLSACTCKRHIVLGYAVLRN